MSTSLQCKNICTCQMGKERSEEKPTSPTAQRHYIHNGKAAGGRLLRRPPPLVGCLGWMYLGRDPLVTKTQQSPRKFRTLALCKKDGLGLETPVC